MSAFEKIFLIGTEWDFVGEIVLRSIVMFILILIVLRLSGRRGVRQLTLFEVAIIIGLGSAAGDPMFQADIPVLYAVIVFSCVITIYKLVTLLASRFKAVGELLEGKAMIVVKDGLFDVKHENDNSYSKMEFFAELRNQSVEHLGQVRLGVLEVDGTLSLLFYGEEDVRYGLPLFPTNYKHVDTAVSQGPFACMYCGLVKDFVGDKFKCERCKRDRWTQAMNTRRIG
ncbi:DUF421 domain-containing protein [Sphingobacterium alkalisoli]|uniref:DUF421 domain-containing protein n=1 Tax=Sphingobacterium alkalisoli TaxID=1874115 RepID=A0A4U0GWT7_9SPHI|nr:YetF domain-containing protein [Sphingobacterium alkalisoli]TJY63466.1 DUF421 domain-containing protein [Sphingobacterium alkalisoli]GGH26241.1 DUF421 domain-containing protein [Sphingobacterium alkalisoli]